MLPPQGQLVASAKDPTVGGTVQLKQPCCVSPKSKSGVKVSRENLRQVHDSSITHGAKQCLLRVSEDASSMPDLHLEQREGPQGDDPIFSKTNPDSQK